MTRLSTVGAVVAIAREKQVTVQAASLAFHAGNVLLALLVLIYATIALFGTGTFLAASLESLTGVGAREFKRLFERVGGTSAGRQRAIVLAGIISVWSSFRLFRAVEVVFAEIYENRKERSMPRRVVDSAVVLLAVGLTLAGMAIVGSLFLFRTGGLAGAVLGIVALWFGMGVLFLPLYYTFSGGGTTLAEVAPGTALAATGWTVSAIGLRAYVQVSRSVDLYGVVGSVLLVLTWLYVVGLSVLLGVILNALLADRIEADPEWVPGRG